MGSWQNYVIGVVAELLSLGCRLGGFRGECWGDVPIGAGLSSSAALTCSLAFGLNELFSLGLDRWTLVRIAQRAEHHYAGTLCGIMDQFAAAMGKAGMAMLLDCRSGSFTYHPLDLGPYTLLLLNTNVTHELSMSAYNDRRRECEEGVSLLKQEHPGISTLRDLSPSDLEKACHQLPPLIYRRCRHVVTENERVGQAVAALRSGDRESLGRLLYASHRSLHTDFEVSCPELDCLVDFAAGREEVAGSRMMGGGFGGCTLQLVRQDALKQYIGAATAHYSAAFGRTLTPIPVRTGDGARTRSNTSSMP
jgi:galactokinase